MNFSVKRKGELNEVNLEITTKYSSPSSPLHYKLLIHSSENISQFFQVEPLPRSGNYLLTINQKQCAPESTVILQQEYAQLCRFMNKYPPHKLVPIIPRTIINSIMELEL